MNQSELQQLLQQAQTASQDKDHETALACYDSVLSETKEEPEYKELRLTAIRERSRLLELMGEREEALAGYESYYLEAGSNKHAVEALVLIGDLHTDMGRHREALDAYDEALNLAEAFNYTFGRAKALVGSSLTLHRLGRTEEGLSNIRKSLGLFQQIEDSEGEMRAWNRLGIIHAQAGQIDRAIHAFQKSLELSREIGERETAINLSNLGECHQVLFNMEDALEYHREALALAESTAFRSVEADTCRNLGYDLYNLGQVKEGIRYLQRALEISDETKQRDVKLQSLYTLALAEIRRENRRMAWKYAEELKRIAESRNYRVYQADALHALGLCHKLDGNLEAAEQRWQEAVFLAHDTGRQFLLWQLHAALADIAPNPGLAQVHLQIAADIIHQIAYPIENEAVRNTFLEAPQVQRVLAHVE
ncbi:MAG TPA: tetratricopeptide repeat protein [Candidatus Sulfomarinibacteraceae bacterium]|nr:tetratricopeptide repeat protein [Candidatus Sulfomarinibacteraceae bacterium]